MRLSTHLPEDLQPRGVQATAGDPLSPLRFNYQVERESSSKPQDAICYSQLLLIQAFNDRESEAVGEGGASRPGNIMLGPVHLETCETMLNEELVILAGCSMTLPSSPSHCAGDSMQFLFSVAFTSGTAAVFAQCAAICIGCLCLG